MFYDLLEHIKNLNFMCHVLWFCVIKWFSQIFFPSPNCCYYHNNNKTNSNNNKTNNNINSDTKH